MNVEQMDKALAQLEILKEVADTMQEVADKDLPRLIDMRERVDSGELSQFKGMGLLVDTYAEMLEAVREKMESLRLRLDEEFRRAL